MPLVEPLPADHDAEIAELADLFNIALGFPPNSVLTMSPGRGDRNAQYRPPPLANGQACVSGRIRQRIVQP
jgi:hypothetical protein